MNGLHRSDDWHRLKAAGFFIIDDQPGQITVSRVSPAEQKIKNWQTLSLALPIGGLLFGFMAGIGGAIAGLILGLLFGGIFFFCLVLPGKSRIGRFSNKVIFTPRNIYFLRDNIEHGSLPREAVQQIVPDQDGYGLRSHKFLADVGYVWAFPMSTENEHLLMNNILMAAFNQPIHLDQEQAASPQSAPAPQIAGLKPVSRE